MANYWMHNGFVRVDDEKMSKSLGNFFTIREVLTKYDPEVVRFFILRAHYRSPLNYSDKHLDDAKAALTRLYTALRNVEISETAIDWQHPQAKRFKEAMDDDLNTAEAMAVLFELAKEKSLEALTLMKQLGAVIGLLQRNPDDFLQGEGVIARANQTLSPVTQVATATGKAEGTSQAHGVGYSINIDDLIQLRLEAKKAKNFAEADRIRKELADAGIILEDTPQGTTWRRA